jgi:hypothetical protein
MKEKTINCLPLLTAATALLESGTGSGCGLKSAAPAGVDNHIRTMRRDVLIITMNDVEVA